MKTLLLAKRRLEAAHFEVEMDGPMVALGETGKIEKFDSSKFFFFFYFFVWA